VDGIPVGILPCNGIKGLERYLTCLDRKPNSDGPTFGVLAMWKAFYLKWGKNFYKSLSQGFDKKDVKIHKWFANEVERNHLCQNISKGADLLIYAGHGRSRGWTGYRGLRWSHIEAYPLEQATGLVICLTCSNLEVAKHNRVPFGVKWVRSGRACAFLGSVSSVKIIPLIKVSNILNKTFAEGNLSTVSALMQRMDQAIKQMNDEELNTCWQTFRLIGHPMEIIFQP